MKKIFLALFVSLCIIFSFSAVAESQSITSDELTKILANGAIEGNTGATISLIVYSDMECPFCIMLHNKIELWKHVKALYGNQINFIYKNNRGVDHKDTEKKALTALCIKKLSGKDAYIEFYHEVLSSSSLQLYSLTRIPGFLRKHNISLPKYNLCMKGKAVREQFNNETEEAQKYNLAGTPGVLIINTKTLKYDTVEGAYPIETFYEKIDALLK